ncbi:hypothetical protein Bbelb_331740 [Branchiostoma belcheri]|nr:hypothetical protein Bbelb_331740 [Branchiostoma belcheri]
MDSCTTYVLADLVCGISVLTGVVVVHNMQQELTGVRQENTGLRERLVTVEHLLDAGTLAGHDRRTVDESEFFARSIKEAIYIRALQPSPNKDGGRHRLSAAYDLLLTESCVICITWRHGSGGLLIP